MKGSATGEAAHEAGFTLLEVMVAFSIAALAIALLYNGATGGLNATATAAKSQEALSLARSHLAAIGKGEAIAPQETSGTDGDGYSWHLRIREIGSRQMALSDSDTANDTKPTNAILYDVQVRESWEVAGRSHDISLETHRVDLRSAAGG
jgi:general secretion pathway protein I